jgi:beta-lactamase class A
LSQRHARPQHVPPPPARVSGATFLLVSLLLLGSGWGVWRGARWLDRQLNPPPEDLRKVVEQPINDVEWQAMVSGLENSAAAWRGQVGIYVKDLHTGRQWNYNPDRLFPSASLIKVPIMASLFGRIDAGQITLDAQIKLTRRERVGGSGSLKWVREGTSLSIMELIYKMITESDNTATKMLLDYAGMDYVAGRFKELGLVHTNIAPEGMSLTSGRVARENYTTAREMASLFERIYAGALVSRQASEFMLDVLKHTKSRSRFRKGLPVGWEIGHKTGLLRRSCHDAGIIFSPRGDYIMVVLTAEVPSYGDAKAFIAKVAALTYKYYKLDADFARAPDAGTVRSL